MPSGEQAKTKPTVTMLAEKLTQLRVCRASCLVALGGGVVTDLVGMLAGLYHRGLPWVALPTTMMAMVDASIGGKTGVNTNDGKNLLGLVNLPKHTWVYPGFLSTLPQAAWQNGLVEAVKHFGLQGQWGQAQHMVPKFLALAPDAPCVRQKVYFNVKRCLACECLKAQIAIKLAMIRGDLADNALVQQERSKQSPQQKRVYLNWGHTVGHALEASQNYQVGHGFAVAVGMLAEQYYAILVFGVASESLISLWSVLHDLGVLNWDWAALEGGMLWQRMLTDKKSTQQCVRGIYVDGHGSSVSVAHYPMEEKQWLSVWLNLVAYLAPVRNQSSHAVAQAIAVGRDQYQANFEAVTRVRAEVSDNFGEIL